MILTVNNSTGGYNRKIQVLCDHCRKAETMQFYADVTVMIDCALAARDYRSKMTALSPQIKKRALPLRFQGLKAMAERSVEDYVEFYVLCFKMQNQTIR